MTRTHLFIIMMALVLFMQPMPAASQSSTIVFVDPIYYAIQLDSNGTSQISVRLRINNNASTALDSFAFRIDSLESTIMNLRSETHDLSYSTAIERRYTVLTVDFDSPIPSGGQKWIELTAVCHDLQNTQLQEANLYGEFTMYIRPLNAFYNLTITILLPEDAVLSHNALVPLFPHPDSNYTTGGSLAFVWNEPVLLPGQERVYIAKYQLSTTLTSTVLITPWTWLFLGLSFLLGIIVARVVPVVLHRVRNIGRVRVVGLTAEEQEFLEVIRRKGGSCLQKDLYREFNLSQSKVSMMITTLEERGLVRRVRSGRENMIYLIEEE